MVNFRLLKPPHLRKHREETATLQKDLKTALSNCEFHKIQLSRARSEATRVQNNNIRFQAEKSTLLRQLNAMEEEFRRVRNLPMQAEELLEEHRGECVELRVKVRDLNLHNASLAEEIGRLRGLLLWERRERERTKKILERSFCNDGNVEQFRG